MPSRLKEGDGGKILVVQVSGKLTRADYDGFIPEVGRLIRRQGSVRILSDMAGFHGWELGAAWEDFKFAIDHSADIERLAMVGEKQWQEGMATSSNPFTNAEMCYLEQTAAAEARKWLAAA